MNHESFWSKQKTALVSFGNLTIFSWVNPLLGAEHLCEQQQWIFILLLLKKGLFRLTGPVVSDLSCNLIKFMHWELNWWSVHSNKITSIGFLCDTHCSRWISCEQDLTLPEVTQAKTFVFSCNTCNVVHPGATEIAGWIHYVKCIQITLPVPHLIVLNKVRSHHGSLLPFHCQTGSPLPVQVFWHCEPSAQLAGRSCTSWMMHTGLLSAAPPEWCTPVVCCTSLDIFSKPARIALWFILMQAVFCYFPWQKWLMLTAMWDYFSGYSKCIVYSPFK